MARLRSALALTLAALLLAPSVAVAATGTTGRTAPSAVPAAPKPAASATATAPAALAVPATLDIQLWPSETEGVSLVVSAEIPASVRLPATVRIPVPAGLTLEWVGEVFGGDTSKDVSRPYATEEGTGGKVLVLTATQSRIVQYEGALSQLTRDGTRYVAELAWVQSAPSASQSWAVKMVAATSDVRTTPAVVGTPQVNAVGERLYSLPSTQLQAGGTQNLSVSFARGASSAPPASSGQGSADSSTVLVVLFGLLGIAVVTLVVMLARAKRRQA
jgi:hypothetical protein